MRIYLMGTNKLNRFTLPNENNEFYSYNYTIENTNKNVLISFEKQEGKWFFKSTGVLNCIINGHVLEQAEIKEYMVYFLKILGMKQVLVLFALPDANDLVHKISLNNINSLTIGVDENNNICYPHPMLKDLQVQIIKKENNYVLSCVGSFNGGIFVNNKRVTTKVLKTGDTLFIYGLKLVLMKDFFVINNPLNKLLFRGLTLDDRVYQYDNTVYDEVTEEDENYKLFSEEDYFYHIPRIKEEIDDKKIVIADLPALGELEEMPWYIKLGTRLTMLAGAFMMGWNIYLGIDQGRNWKTLLPRVVMCISMLIAAFIVPKILTNYNKKKFQEKKDKRDTKFTAYLDEKEKTIDLTTKKNIQIMNDNYLSSTACKTINSNNRFFWSREVGDKDFARVRLGIGTIDNPIEIAATEKEFIIESEPLQERVFQIVNKYKKINNVPITVSLLEKKISAFIVENQNIEAHDYFKNIIAQLITLQSAADLKIVIFTDETNEDKWDFVRFMPHSWSEDKSIRYFATNTEDMKKISESILEELKERKLKLDGKVNDEDEAEKKLSRNDIHFKPHYIIISDNYKNNMRVPVIDEVLKNPDANYGMSLIFLSETLKNLPSECSTFIEIGNKDGAILEKNISSNNQIIFNFEYDDSIDIRKICNYELNIPLVPKDGISQLPTSISFLDMYGVSKIEQLNITNRWKENDPVISLAAPIGVYASGETFVLNLHEKNHGPHGLIAGSTGSGKSEFIITYILSMCVNYHPDEVQFVLIDYKGGGLAGAFENREIGISIPHLAGTITNLDTASINRSLISINSELKRRQKIFNEARDSLGESTMDIYKYQKYYREKQVSEPLPHLFIISDEFAELKKQQPEFMQELISTARIGRSLGVHLILATQKPSGIVNDQIWSNSKFKVCLKVQDRSDSVEVLKRPEAASIKEAGRFYLQVGYDDFFDKGQSAWSGAKYVPSDKIIQQIDNSVTYLSNSGDVIKSVKDIVKVDTSVDLGDQLTNIVKYINKVGADENIKSKKLWLDPIPEEIFVDDLKAKYNYTSTPYEINPIIGEYDNPAGQEQGLLTINLTKTGNTIISGIAGSGKENLLNTIIMSTVMNHRPEEVNFYIIDCGSESLKIYNKMPHVGDIALQEDRELVLGIFNLVVKEIDRRKELMVDYSGNYEEYINSSGEKLPLMIVVINNFDSFLDTYGRYADDLTALFRDGARYGVKFIITEVSANALKGKNLQYFPNKLILKLNNDLDYRSYFGMPKGLIPANLFGRGLENLNDTCNEFQTALICEKDRINSLIRESSKVYSESYDVKAKKIPAIPKVVYASKMLEHTSTIDKVPVGYSTDTKDVTYYNFDKKFNIITNNGMNEERMSFLYSLINVMSTIENVKVKVVDFIDAYEKQLANVEVFDSLDKDKMIINLNNDIMSNKDSKETKVYFLFGIGKYKAELSEQPQLLLNDLFMKVTTVENVRFVLIDTVNIFKNLLSEQWYQANVDNSCGIWLAEDASNQLIINAPNITTEESRIVFPCIAYTVEDNKHTIIKYMVEDDIKKEE